MTMTLDRATVMAFESEYSCSAPLTLLNQVNSSVLIFCDAQHSSVAVPEKGFQKTENCEHNVVFTVVFVYSS